MDNLITACFECNHGKQARKLVNTDDSTGPDFKYLLDEYVSSPADALTMLHSAYSSALVVFLAPLREKWDAVVKPVTGFDCPTFELCLFASWFSFDHICSAFELAARQFQDGDVGNHRWSVITRIQQLCEWQRDTLNDINETMRMVFNEAEKS
jgi:hypothetical protein